VKPDWRPEITNVLASVDAGCNSTVSPGVDPLVYGDAVFIYIDSDGNAATGSPTFSGADTVVGTLGGTSGGGPTRGVWNGSGFTFTDKRLSAPHHPGGFTANVDRLAPVPGATSRVTVGTMYSGVYDSSSSPAPARTLPPR